MTRTERAFESIEGKGKKCWKPAFSPFPTMISTRAQTENIILNLSSVIALSLVMAKILWLILLLNVFYPFQNLKCC